MSSQLSALDIAILSGGFSKDAIKQHPGFERGDAPIKNCAIQVNQLAIPQFPAKGHESIPFDMFSPNALFSMTKDELIVHQKSMAEKLLEVYQQQIEVLGELGRSSRAAIQNADAIDRRRQFYFCYLKSILECPPTTGFEQLENLISLRKLWRGQMLAKFSEKVCAFRGCAQQAIHGTQYCWWHILNDPQQKIFCPCPACGLPMIKCDPQGCPARHRASEKA